VPGKVPEAMQLISTGICDVVWTTTMDKDALKVKKFKLDNPLGKFSTEIHEIIQDMENHKEEALALNLTRTPGEKDETGLTQFMGIQGFRVQRLIKGDALTVRALSSKVLSSMSAMSVVAASSIVKTYELHKKKLPFLPPAIREAFDIEAGTYFDYDMHITDIDYEGFKEWENRKIAYYEEFLSKRKEFIDSKNTKQYIPTSPNPSTHK